MKTLGQFLTFFLVFAVLGLSGSALAKVGDPAPDFMLQDLNGRTHSANIYKGKVLVLFYLGHN